MSVSINSFGDLRKLIFHNAAMTFGARLREAREALSLSQQDVDERLAVSRAAVSQWENDATFPDMDKIATLGDLLYAEPCWLVFGVHSSQSVSITKTIVRDAATFILQRAAADELPSDPESLGKIIGTTAEGWALARRQAINELSDDGTQPLPLPQEMEN